MADIITGTVFRSISGFYDVFTNDGTVRCKPRGVFRKTGVSPLVGDHVELSLITQETGTIDKILPRTNTFIRPAVANIDQLVVFASGAIPVTDPFLIDRISAIAQHHNCPCVICINKHDLAPAQDLYDIYSKAGFRTIFTSAVTGEGIDELRSLLAGKTSAFTGNSGVGKSSILNALDPTLSIQVGDVSEKLGRGRHTTRHVELFRIEGDAFIADTPGFSSFDTERLGMMMKEDLPHAFIDFAPYIGGCRFTDCSHTKEIGCCVLEAVSDGRISRTRHESYLRLYEQIKHIDQWQLDQRN